MREHVDRVRCTCSVPGERYKVPGDYFHKKTRPPASWGIPAAWQDSQLPTPQVHSTPLTSLTWSTGSDPHYSRVSLLNLGRDSQLFSANALYTTSIFRSYTMYAYLECVSWDSYYYPIMTKWVTSRLADRKTRNSYHVCKPLRGVH